MTKNKSTSTQINALDVESLNSAVNSLRLDELCVNLELIHGFMFYWFGVPTTQVIESLQLNIPILSQFIDFSTVIQRLAHIDEYTKGRFHSVILSEFFPELSETKAAFLTAIEEYPPSTMKGVSRLKSIAREAGADLEIEAAIYLACLGFDDLISTKKIVEKWHDSICYKIENGSPVGPIPDHLMQKAKDRTIKLHDAAELLTFNDHLPGFFSYFDHEEEAIDAAFVRAVETFHIKGFEPWVEARIDELSMGPIDGCDPIQGAWWLFWWSRSDYALKAATELGLDFWLLTILNSGLERNAPWKCFDQNSKTPRTHDNIAVAGFLLFIWYRIQSKNVNDVFLTKATGVLLAAQTRSGGWPVFNDSTSPDIMATCAAIHGLCLHQPDGWEKMVKKGAEWLLKQQDNDGLWRISGGPAVLISVTALESIELANKSTRISFSLPHNMINNLIEMTENPITEHEENKLNCNNEEWHNPSPPKQEFRSYDQVLPTAVPQVAIVVATEVELKQTLRCLHPFEGENAILSVSYGNKTYYLGSFGKFRAVVVRSEMGSGGVGGATLTTYNLIKEWTPEAVFLIGIAFGIDPNKQMPADVLVATQIIPYELQRKGSKVVFRSPIPATSPMLIDRFRNALGWVFKRPDDSAVRFHAGPLFSGDKLIDDKSFKKQLTDHYPDAIGGEMEGAGFYAAAEERKVDWIVVKAVCDWADGEKGKSYQEMAAAAAVSLTEFVLTNPNALDGNRRI